MGVAMAPRLWGTGESWEGNRKTGRDEQEATMGYVKREPPGPGRRTPRMVWIEEANQMKYKQVFMKLWMGNRPNRNG